MLCILLIVLLVSITMLFAQALLGPLLKEQAEQLLAQHVGGVWQIESVQRLDLNGAQLIGIRQLSSESSNKFQAVHIEQLAVQWDVWQVWSDPLRALRSIDLGLVDLELDFKRAHWFSSQPTADQQAEFSLPAYQEIAGNILQVLDQFHPDLQASASIQARWHGLQLHAGDESSTGAGSGELGLAWNAGALVIRDATLQHQGTFAEVEYLRWHPQQGFQRLERAKLNQLDLGQWRGSPIGLLDASIYLNDQRLLMAIEVNGELVRADWHGSLMAGLALDRWHLATLRGEGQMDLLLPKPFAGSIRTFLAMEGTLVDPEFDFLLSGKGLRVADWPEMNADLTLRAEERSLSIPWVEVASPTWSYLGQDVALLRWKDDGSWELQGQPRLDYAAVIQPKHREKPDVEWDLQGNIDGIRAGSVRMQSFPISWFAPLFPLLNASPTRLTMDVQWQDFAKELSGTVSLDKLFVFAEQDLSMGFGLSSEANRLRLSVLSAGETRTDYIRGEGFINGTFRSTWNDLYALSDRPLHAALELVEFPLQFLENIFPHIDFAGGVADGTLDLKGTLAAITPQAQVSLRDGRMRLDDRLPPLTSVQGDVRFSPGQLELTDVQAELGYGPVSVSGRWSLDPAVHHDLKITAKQALLIARSDLRVRLDGRVSLTGLPANPLLSGDIAVSDLLYSPRESWWQLGAQAGQRVRVNDPLTQLFSIDEEPWKSMRFDLTVYDGRLDSWSDDQSRAWILSHFARLPLRLDMRLRGSGGVPEPAGTISARRGEINLPFTSYRVDNALLVFTENNPFEPRIEASLRTRMVGYDVRLQLTGLLSDPRVSVNTSPPLPTNQALLLATTGIAPADTDNTQGAALSVAIPFVIQQIRDAVFGLQDPDSGPSFWDRFQMVLGEERSENGVASARTEFFLGRRFYLFAERDGFENYNGGILWRRILGDDEAETPFALTQTEVVEPLPIAWIVQSVKEGEASAFNPRELLLLVKRQRQNFDTGQGELLHAADAAARMQLALREQGYAWAEVTIHAEHDRHSGHLREVQFLVDTGPQWRWGRTWIEGAPDALADELNALRLGHVAQRTVFNQRRLDALRSDLIEVLRLQGYTKPAIEIALSTFRPEQPFIQARIRIMPGQRFVFEQVTLEGIEHLPPEVQNRLRRETLSLIGRPWLRRSAIALRARLVGMLQSEGYFWAHIASTIDEPEEASERQTGIARPVHFVVSSGPVGIIRSVIIEGLNRTSYRYARNRLRLNDGDMITREALDRAGSRMRATVPLRRLDIAVHAVGAQTSTQEADILVKLDEGPSRFFEAYTGYGSYEGVRGGIRYIDNHVLGHGRQWSVGAHGSEKHVLGRTAFSDADILGDDRRLTLTLEGGFREEPSFDQSRLAYNPEAFIPLANDMSLTLGYRLEFSRTTNVANPLSPEDVDESTQRVAIFDVDWALVKMDDLWLPTSGYRLELGLGIADRSLGSSRDFFELRGRLGGLVSFDDAGKWGLAGLLGYTGRKTLDGDETLPIAERLFLGGANSVRSFERALLGPGQRGEPTGGLSSAFAQLEFRLPIYDDLRAALFYDIGTVSEKPWEIHADNGVGHGIGAGIRYVLPVGPLRIDAAYNPGDRLAARNRFAVQFAIGFTF